MLEQVIDGTTPWDHKPIFQLSGEEDLELSIRLLVKGQLEYVELLPACLVQRPAIVVHEIRKFTKRIRALLKLTSAARPAGTTREAMLALKELSAELSPAREAIVHAITFQNLLSISRQPLELDAHIYAQLESAALESQKDVVDNERLHKKLNAATTTVRSWSEGFSITVTLYDFLLIELRNSYRRARKAFQKCAGSPDPDLLHSYRKLVKTLWYFLRMLEKWLNEEGEGVTLAVDDLGAILGDTHDLDTLKHNLSEGSAAKARSWASEELMSIWERTRLHYWETAYQRSSEIFALRPKQFLEMLTRDR